MRSNSNLDLSNRNPHSGLVVRLICITDTYILDNFAALKTLIRRKTEENTNGPTVSIHTGDFLSPSLISSLDYGKSMMRVMNELPIDIAIFGNHEFDLPPDKLFQRIAEFKGRIINSNLSNHPTSKLPHVCTRYTLTATSPDKAVTKKVGFFSMLTHAQNCYRPGSLSGAQLRNPWKAGHECIQSLIENEKADLVIPLSHMYVPDDEKSCRDFDIPLVISGHDHHVVNTTIEGTRLVKAGSDAYNALVIDLKWHDQASECKIEVEVVPTRTYPPDKDLLATVMECERVVEHLRHTQLVVVPSQYLPLDSRQPRVRTNSAGSFICTELREALNSESPKHSPFVHAVLLPGGTRGGKLHRTGSRFSLSDLQEELGTRCGIQAIELPGKVLLNAIRDSQTRKGPYTHYMHFDDGVILDAKHTVTHIDGKEIEMDRVYRVGYSAKRYLSRNGPMGMSKYFEENSERVPPEDAEIPGDQLLLRYWGEKVWTTILTRCGSVDQVFRKLDTDDDGVVSVDEVKGNRIGPNEKTFGRFELEYEEAQGGQLGF